MNMTYNDYIQNPMGRENAVYSARYMYRDLYTQKLDTIMVRENGKINYKLYYTKDERYIVHMKIPSEAVPNFYYDTVIEFYTNNEVNKHSNSLDKYYTKFYSNDPSFVFTFAHAFIKNKMFVEDMIPKMSKEAVKNKAKVFIVPSENYDEAVKLKKEHNYDIEIIEADNLHNVIEKLKNR